METVCIVYIIFENDFLLHNRVTLQSRDLTDLVQSKKIYPRGVGGDKYIRKRFYDNAFTLHST